MQATISEVAVDISADAQEPSLVQDSSSTEPGRVDLLHSLASHQTPQAEGEKDAHPDLLADIIKTDKSTDQATEAAHDPTSSRTSGWSNASASKSSSFRNSMSLSLQKKQSGLPGKWGFSFATLLFYLNIALKVLSVYKEYYSPPVRPLAYLPARMLTRASVRARIRAPACTSARPVNKNV